MTKDALKGGIEMTKRIGIINNVLEVMSHFAVLAVFLAFSAVVL